MFYILLCNAFKEKCNIKKKDVILSKKRVA
jgi:hypothetical protein